MKGRDCVMSFGSVGAVRMAVVRELLLKTIVVISIRVLPDLLM